MVTIQDGAHHCECDDANAWEDLESRMIVRHVCDLDGNWLYEFEDSLQGRDLSRFDWPRANFKDYDLRETDLSGTKLVEADMRGADLRGAILRGTDFTGALMDGVTLDETTRTDAATIFPEGVKEVEAYLNAKRLDKQGEARRDENGICCARDIGPTMAALAAVLPSPDDDTNQADHDRLRAVETILIQAAGVAPKFEDLNLEEIDRVYGMMKSALTPFGDDMKLLFSAFQPGNAPLGGNHRQYALECIDEFLFLGGWRGNRPGFDRPIRSRSRAHALVERCAREYYPKVITLFLLVQNWLKQNVDMGDAPQTALGADAHEAVDKWLYRLEFAMQAKDRLPVPTEFQPEVLVMRRGKFPPFDDVRLKECVKAWHDREPIKIHEYYEDSARIDTRRYSERELAFLKLVRETMADVTAKALMMVEPVEVMTQTPKTSVVSEVNDVELTTNEKDDFIFTWPCIASMIRETEKTARRREKEGLLRVQRNRFNRVFCTKSEIERYLRENPR